MKILIFIRVDPVSDIQLFLQSIPKTLVGPLYLLYCPQSPFTLQRRGLDYFQHVRGRQRLHRGRTCSNRCPAIVRLRLSCYCTPAELCRGHDNHLGQYAGRTVGSPGLWHVLFKAIHFGCRQVVSLQLFSEFAPSLARKKHRVASSLLVSRVLKPLKHCTFFA